MNESDKKPDERGNRMTIRPVPQSDGQAEKPRPADGESEAAKSDTAVAAALAMLSERIERLAGDMDRSQLRDYVELTRKPLALIWRNLLSGLARGVGIAIGFTFFAATIVYILQALGKLNLPIVGDYIADIVRIVQRQLQINPY